MKSLPVLTALLLAVAATGQDPRWRPDERVVLREFSLVRAVAASQAYVYGATDAGLVIRDLRFRRWLPPRTPLDGYPVETVLAAYADPVEEAVWLGTAAGLIKYTPLLERFERIDVAGGVRAIGGDPRDPAAGIWLVTGRGWAFLPRGAVFPVPGTPPDRLSGSIGLDALRAAYPFVDAMAVPVLTDDRLRTVRFTDAARVPGSEVFWLGTTGRGLIELDAPIVRFEPQPFGLLADGVGAVFVGPDGVWAATDGFGRQQGLTYVSTELDRWRWEEGPPAVGFGASVFRALIGRQRHLWIGTDHGLWQVEPGRSHRRFGTAQGLPDASVYALAQGPSGLWVGTALGLGHMADDETVTTVDPGITVLALAAARDTVWVGTTAGLGIAWPGADGVLVPGDVLQVPELRGPVLALAIRGDTIVVVTPDRIVWRGGRRGTWSVERPLSPELGMLRAVAADEGGVWIGGGIGIAWFDFATRTFRVHAGGSVIPGSVRGLGVDRDYLWVGTEHGLVRFRKRVLLP